MRCLARGLLCALAVFPIFCASAVQLDEYKQRRATLRAAVGDSIVILFGKTESSTGDIRNGFFQESNFYYLTGWSEPGAILFLTPKSEALLIPRRDPAAERWTGRKAAPADENTRAVTGFDTVLESESFEAILPSRLQEGKAVLTLFGSPEYESMRKLLPTREFHDAALPIARLRMKKSPAEIALIQHATDAGIEAHEAAWKRIQPGLSEHQVAATMTSVYFERGCERHAYAPIVGSGANAAVLHYSKNSRKMDAGELLLMDVGPECSMYATDITRTVPVNGKFTPRQRELYDIVLGAQSAALGAIKPGALLGSRFTKGGVQQIVIDYFNSHGKDKHGKPLGQYFIHGIGHHVGLDVHDAFDPAMPLEAGMVITLEPGLYIPDEGIGIRIEDMVLVTENGAKLLSERLPRDAGAIEKAMRAR